MGGLTFSGAVNVVRFTRLLGSPARRTGFVALLDPAN
jgi:hypothetical protein